MVVYKNKNNRRVFGRNQSFSYIFARGHEGRKFSKKYKKYLKSANARIDPTLEKKYGILYNASTGHILRRKNYMDGRYKHTSRLKPSRVPYFTYENGVLRRRPTSVVSQFADIEDMVYNAADNFNTRAFSLELESAEVDGVRQTFNFADITHFQNWFNMIMNADVAMMDVNYVGQAYKFREAIRENNKHVFRRVLNFENSIRPIRGGCNDRCLRDIVFHMTKKGPFYTFDLFNPKSKNNNCGIACLRELDNVDFGDKWIKAIRRQFGIPTKARLSPEEVQKIYLHYRTDDKLLIITDDTFDGEVRDNYKYLWYKKGHYRVIEKMKRRKIITERKRRAVLAFDFETRHTEAKEYIGEAEARRLKDTICQIVYRPLARNGKKKVKSRCFTTNAQKSSARQFLDFLREEHVKNRHYTCIAHNGANFDVYLLLKEMTENEICHSDFQRRGLSIISADIFGHVFKDTACFMPASLNSLCASFKISDENKKLKSFEIPIDNFRGDAGDAQHTKTLTSMEMCFYKPHLSFEEFMLLEKSEPEFWTLYKKYCENDSRALLELWEKFREAYDKVVIEMGGGNNWMLKQGCTLNSKCTIGGLAKKLLETTMIGNKWNKRYKLFLAEGPETPTETYPKYQFVCKFKRGGISHCHQPGRHDHKVTSVDICSQYPACMKWMKIPIGESEWVHKYQKNRHGFYHLKNVRFAVPDGTFMPACPQPEKGQSLRWNKKYFAEAYLDSYMIEYLQKHCRLTSFDVVRGLVSKQFMRGNFLFEKYVKPLFNAKKMQDKYKKERDDRYNPAFRSCIKLFLNSLTGKCVENPAKYFQIQYVQGDSDAANMRGVQYIKTYRNTKPNYWVVAGCMIYSYSKRLLYEYARLIPTPIIHTETDSLYFDQRSYDEFKTNVENYDGFYPVKFGNELGNIKLEHITEGPSYFLGKKFYYLVCEEEGEVTRIKGIPVKTISECGSTIPLVNKELYEDVFQGKSVIKRFSSIRRTLDGDTRLTAFIQHRTVKPIMPKYPTYS